MKALHLSYSTCPNDTFMFDALVNGKINRGDLKFIVHLADIEELNQRAGQGIPDVTKLSIAAVANVAGEYELLRSGAAIGFGNGPLLVSKRKIFPDELKDVRIAIPGEKTTANLLLKILFPEASNKHEYLFSAIEEVVLDNECDAGLLIHETRFTYESRGLKKIVDLGEEWEKKTGLPVPLGGIVVRKSLPAEVKKVLGELLSESVRFALDHPDEPLSYMKQHAQELSGEVIYKHVNLYVNEFSVRMGPDGENAVLTLLGKAAEAGILPHAGHDIFVKD
ncbi:MAG: 1,4-dihydroxy-6-naphthoate synthase [Bacteroidales bacterium]